MPHTALQPSFAKGELSPELHRRIDLAAYQIGVKTAKNMCVLPRGGLQSRTGTTYVAATKTAANPSRLVEFVFSTLQAYVLEFGHNYIRFFMDGGQIVSPDDTPYEIASPWTKDEIWTLKFEQSADTLYIFSAKQTRKLTRTGHTAWTLTAVNFEPGPLLKENTDITKTITLSGKVQTARPMADIATGGWTSTAATLYEALDETVPDDADSISSALATAKIQLGTVTAPSTRKGHVLKIRALLGAVAGVTVALYAGAVKVSEMQLADPGGKARTYDLLIPEYNASLIGDYSDLEVWITGTGSTGAAVYWLRFQCPLATGVIGETVTDTSLFQGDTVTITASKSLFDSLHVGSIWAVRYYSNAKSYYFGTPQRNAYVSFPIPVNGDWSFTMDVKAGDINEVDQFIEKSIDDGATWYKKKVIAATEDKVSREFTGSEEEECWLRLTREDDPALTDSAAFTLTTQGREVYTYFRITAVTNATTAEGVLVSSLTRPGIALANWSEAAWSDKRGWPTAGAFFQNRLTAGGNASDPNTFAMSVIDDYENHSVHIPQVDDDSISDRLPARQVNAIQWLVPIQSLIVLTSDSEWSVSPAANGVLAHGSRLIKQQTYFGADGRVEPVIMGEAVVFLQRGGAKVRSLGYSYEIDGYTGSDLTVMADHLFDGYTIVDWAYQQVPHSILWAVRSDGALLSFTFHKEHDVWGWTRHETQGTFESVACIPGSAQDEVYFLVRRTVNGIQQRYVEQLAQRDVSGKQAFFGVDCGLAYTGTAATVITGLDHLEGKRVVALADGMKAYKTVSSGQITLDKAASLVHVGLEYEYLFNSLQIDLNGTADRKKAINSVSLSLLNSHGGEAGTKEDGLFVPIPYPDDKNLFSGDVNSLSLTTGWNYAGQLILKGSGALPMHILSIAPQVSVGGK